MRISHWHRRATTVLTGLALFTLTTLALPLGAAAQPAGPSPEPNPVEVIPPPDGPPPGANDWSCTPSPEHPRPVVLVHGTNGNMAITWSELSPILADQGYCVFTLNYGGGRMVVPPYEMVWGVRDIRSSAAELAGFVDRVLASTGASQVDVVGHSQGGTVARQYLRFNGGADPADPQRNKVHSLVTLGATNHGTTWASDIAQTVFEIAAYLGYASEDLRSQIFGVAVAQQTIGSPLLQELNEGSDTMPGVDYTVIATRYDEVVTPPSLTFLRSSNVASVRNVWVQDGCDVNTVSHANLVRDQRTLHLVLVGLDPSHAGDHTAPCTHTE